VEVDAFAKINLFLAVVGKRRDGYHELVSIMQTVNLCDNLLLHKVKKNHNTNLVQLSTNIPKLPIDNKNLVVKAANLFMKDNNITHPVQIKLNKRIPIGAGLGGGSSDCAAALLGLNQLFDLKIPLSELMEMGKTLGADVPFCLLANIHGGAALAKGIGEKLTPLPPHPNCNIILAYPQIHISTKKIFKQLNFEGTFTKEHPQLDSFMAAYESRDIAQIAKNFKNTFTPITSGLHPQISTIITDLQNQGALGASMTGTGSTVFAYFDNEDNAKTACNTLQKNHTNTRFFITSLRT